MHAPAAPASPHLAVQVTRNLTAAAATRPSSCSTGSSRHWPAILCSIKMASLLLMPLLAAACTCTLLSVLTGLGWGCPRTVIAESSQFLPPTQLHAEPEACVL